jgi:hypothetical protein
VKSTVTFKQFFYESITAGVALGGSTGGFSPDNISGSDFYAPNDTRVPKGGAVYTRAGKITSKRNKNRKKNKKNIKK